MKMIVTLSYKLENKMRDLFSSRIIRADVKDAIILEYWSFHVAAIKSNIAPRNAFKKIKPTIQKAVPSQRNNN